MKKIISLFFLVSIVGGNVSFGFDTAKVCERAKVCRTSPGVTAAKIRVTNNTSLPKGNFFAECDSAYKTKIAFNIPCSGKTCHRVKGDFTCDQLGKKLSGDLD